MRPVGWGLIGLLHLGGCTGTTGGPDSASVTDGVLADAGADVVVAVGQEATLDGSGSVGIEHRWDFGDGEVGDAPVTTHTWQSPGHYTAVLTVTGEDGATQSDSAKVTVHRPAAATPPVWSSTVAVDADGAVWVAQPESGAVVRVTDSGADIVEVCALPRTLSAAGSALAVACGDDQLVTVHTETLATTVVELPRASVPYGVAGRDGTWWVTLTGQGQVAEVTEGTVQRWDVGTDPRGVAVLSDGTVVVPRWRSDPNGAQVYVVAGDAVATVDLALDTRGDSDTTTGGVPNLVEVAVPSPDEGELYVPALHANVLQGTFVGTDELTHETSLRAVLGVIEDHSGAWTERFEDRTQFDERGRSIAVVPSPLGDLLYVLHPGVGAVSVLDAYNGNLAGSVLGVGTFPRGLALSQDGQTLYVDAWLDRELRAYDVSSLSTNPPLLWAASTVAQEPLDDQVLLGKRVFHDASDDRMTQDGYISCAHCHPDGDHDGLTWDFTQRGEGMRNTTSLLGRAGTAMGPLHWTANFDEVQDFEHDIRGPFSGTGFLDDSDWAECGEPLGEPKAGRSEDLDAMAAYLETLDTAPTSPWSADAAADNGLDADDGTGAALFEAAGCADCHPAPLYTDSSLELAVRHDVGTLTDASGQRLGETLDGLDTPTLLGAWSSPPYLHDGSAETLDAAIAAHDSAVGLSASDLDALARFVQGL